MLKRDCFEDSYRQKELRSLEATQINQECVIHRGLEITTSQ
jgi:hypothetical protein